MRNAFGTSPQRGSGFAADNDPVFAERASSLDQTAVVWSHSGEVVAASPLASGAGIYEIDVARFPTEFNLGAALNMRRASHSNVPPLSQESLFLTTLPDFSERTRILALDGEKLALDDVSLAEWLVEAERNVAVGTDNHQLFETSLEDTACTIRRLPNGQVAMTEAPRQHVQAARERVRVLLGDRASSHLNLCIETPLRTVVRYYLTALREGGDALHAGRETEVTAFLIISETGFSYGLWSPKAGLFSEYGFLAPTEISQAKATRDPFAYTATAQPHGVEPATDEAAEQDARVEAYIRKAIGQLLSQLSPETLERLELTSYAQIVWASDGRMAETIKPIVAEYTGSTGMEFFHIDTPVDEAEAGGLLFGSFTFGDATVTGAEILPPVNLARDILVLADREEIERRFAEEAVQKDRRGRAVFSILAGPVMVAAILLALIAGALWSMLTTAYRDSRATAKTQELKPALDRRNSYEANLKWYQEFIKQVSDLRRQQPAGIGLLYELNSNYPTGFDPSFYVSDMKLSPNGDLEMKGLARNKDAIASFLKALEFAGGPESGSRLFSNLAYEVQESVEPTTAAGQQKLPTMTGSVLTANQTAPGIISWSIKGNYVPVAEFAPPDPKAKPAAAPGAKPAVPTPATPAASQKPAG
jgi:hypothetical protein